jgi:hypothetical protein
MGCSEAVSRPQTPLPCRNRELREFLADRLPGRHFEKLLQPRELLFGGVLARHGHDVVSFF